ncbi:uncharacterized protein PG998_011642 [Apiospora kogelbergensis]|uniref:uncharacterized protein n=1 Tax=Apiospora kogelbergensis TaxID=1337665 RepID=UPI00312E187A
MSTQSEPTIETWIAAQRQSHLPPNEEQLAAFRDLFVTSSPDADGLSQIATRIAKPYIKPWDESRVDRLWVIIHSAVEELTSQNDKLVALVLALQRLPDGKGLRGVHRIGVVSDYSEKDPDRGKNRKAFVNYNTFLAKLTAQSGDVNILLLQRDRGGRLMRWALERTPWDENSPTYEPPDGPWVSDDDSDEDSDEDSAEYSDGDEGDKEEEGVQEEEEDDGVEEEEEEEEDPNYKITLLDAIVPAAAQWIKYCPRQMYEMAAAGGEMSNDNHSNFDTKRGYYSLERWAYWRNRFEEISTMEMLEEGTRRIAQETMERMDAMAKELAKE